VRLEGWTSEETNVMATRLRAATPSRAGILAPFAVATALYVAGLAGAERTFRNTWFADFSPGGSPPWYFIGQDLVDGVWGAAGCALLCLFSVLSARRLGATVWWAFAAGVVPFAHRVGLGLNVWLHTAGSLTPFEATTAWATFDEYLQSREIASETSLVVGMLVAACSVGWYALTSKGERRGASEA
jgi:hypothetical protein